MTLLTGEIVEIEHGEWTSMAKVRIGDAYIRVPLQLVPEAKPGDRILVEGGVAVGVVDDETMKG